MKKYKKYILLILALNMLFFSFESKKREAEAFVLSTTALVVGALATLAVGGTVASQSVTEDLGQDILNKMTAGGFDIKDYLMEKAMAGYFTFHMKQEFAELANSAVQTKVDTISHYKSRPVVNHNVKPTVAENATFNVAQLFSPVTSSNEFVVGTTLALSFVAVEAIPANTEFQVIANGQKIYGQVELSEIAAGQTVNLEYTISDYFDGYYDFQSAAVQEYLITATPYAGSYEIGYSNPYVVSNLNISVTQPIAASDALVYDQFGAVSADPAARAGTITDRLNIGATYDIDGTANLTGATTIDQVATINPDSIGTGETSGLGGYINMIINAIKALAGWIAAAFVGMFQDILDALSSLQGMLSSMLGKIISAIYSIPTSIGNYISNVTRAIDNLPVWNIYGAIQEMIGTLSGVLYETSANIKTGMDDLWEDAGAIWSGMGDTLNNIKTDMGAKIGAMSDTMSGGIDNIRTDVGSMMDNLRTGIDSLAASAAANMASWGQLTLDGIDAGIGAITSGLTNIWTKTTTAIETAATATTTAINTGIGTITDGLTTITDWVIGFPAMFYSWFVPPDFSFLGPLITQASNDLEDKLGTLPSLADIGSAITIQEKSIYDIEITLMGNNYKIVPIALKPTIDRARPFLTAAVNLTSITFLIHRNKRELFK